jgi:hypothetical protein
MLSKVSCKKVVSLPEDAETGSLNDPVAMVRKC